MSTINASISYFPQPTSAHHPAQVRAAAPGRTGQVRLTRRGRVVVVALALLMLLSLFFVFGPGSVATDREGTPEQSTIVQVAPGQTLWEIADEAAGSASTVEMIEKIRVLNSLDDVMITAGQRLRVPIAD